MSTPWSDWTGPPTESTCLEHTRDLPTATLVLNLRQEASELPLGSTLEILLSVSAERMECMLGKHECGKWQLPERL